MYKKPDLACAAKLAKLVAAADIPTPNLTEACFLLGREYPASYDKAVIEERLVCLSSLGPRYAMISGISYEKGRIGVASYDSKTRTHDYFPTVREPGYFHGAGDVFAAALVSGLLNALDVKQSARLAHDMVHESIIETMADGEKDMRFGLHFEKALPFFIEEIAKRKAGTLKDSAFAAEGKETTR